MDVFYEILSFNSLNRIANIIPGDIQFTKAWEK